jgi:hyperosmotically inducible protein
MRLECSFRLKAEALLKAEVLILVLLLSACAATTSRTTDDATTTTRVKIALLNDARVGGLRLDVKTFQGVVTLSGTVKSEADEQAAIAAARKIQGVRDVKSELKIEGSQGVRASAVQ